MNAVLKVLKWLLGLLENYRWWIFSVIYLFGVWVYKFICNADWLASFYSAIGLFALSVSTDFPSAKVGYMTWVYIAGFLGAFYTVTSVISLVAKRFIDKQSVIEASKAPYILVCGLGKKGSAYIDSELQDSQNVNIIAIEKDTQNSNIEQYRAKGIAVKVANAKDVDVLGKLNLSQLKHIVVLAGKDTDNLEIALSLRVLFSKSDFDVKKLYIHIDDKGLDKFYKDGGLLDDSAKLEVKIFSMSHNGAKALFLEHSVDGENRTYMDSDKPFSLVVSGYSKLSVEVIGQICELAHLPNENKVTIYCLDQDIETFKKTIDCKYLNINKIPNIKLEYIALDYQSKDFYVHEVWKNEITNIMLCYDDAGINLDIASELADTTYLTEIYNKSLQAKIHVAIYENKMLAQNINGNEKHFEYFDVFAQTSYTSSKEMIIDEKFELIAKCIHSGYVMRYNPDAMFSDDEGIGKAWSKTAKITDRISNRAQAFHIPLKLKAMGLCIDTSSIGVADRVLHNKKQFANSVLKDDLKVLDLDVESMKKRTELLVGDNQWSTESFDYFPQEYSTLMEKLLRAEHNRWNAHHWLKGWEHNEEKIPELKLHDCLVPLHNLPDNKRHTIIYDIYAVLYIPNLLSKAGYIINECESKDT